MKYCNKCGAQSNDNDKFCIKCGNKFEDKNVINNDGENTNSENKSNQSQTSHNDDNKSIKNIMSDNEENKNTIDNDDNNIKKDASSEQKDNKDQNGTITEEKNSQVKNNDISDTSKIDMSEALKNTNDIAPKQNHNTSHSNKNNGNHKKNNKDNYSNNHRYNNAYADVDFPKRNEKSLSSKIFTTAIIILIVFLVGLCVVFHKKIEGKYYVMKCHDALNQNDRLKYATQALKADSTEETMGVLKDTILDIAKTDVDLAEDKFSQISSSLTQSDAKTIETAIKEKKIDKLCNDSKYEDALRQFGELDKLGVDFKTNEHYDDIMLNVIAKITSTTLMGNKGVLMDSNSICYEDFDNDGFDEVIEVKGRSEYKYNSDVKVNLYRYQDGKYKLADTKIISNAHNKGIQGVYKYEGEAKGVFIKYESGANHGTSVYGVENGWLSLKGSVYGNDYTRPDDANDDGVYEVLSHSKSYVTSPSKEISKWYSIHKDGSAPTELNISDAQVKSNKTKTNTGDYIFKDSDSTYLTEEDMQGLSKDTLALARNEIFARHGYAFKEEPFKSYFKSKKWYTPNPNYDGSDSTLNKYEIANYKVIQSWEKK